MEEYRDTPLDEAINYARLFEAIRIRFPGVGWVGQRRPVEGSGGEMLLCER